MVSDTVRSYVRRNIKVDQRKDSKKYHNEYYAKVRRFKVSKK